MWNEMGNGGLCFCHNSNVYMEWHHRHYQFQKCSSICFCILFCYLFATIFVFSLLWLKTRFIIICCSKLKTFRSEPSWNLNSLYVHDWHGSSLRAKVHCRMLEYWMFVDVLQMPLHCSSIDDWLLHEMYSDYYMGNPLMMMMMIWSLKIFFGSIHCIHAQKKNHKQTGMMWNFTVIWPNSINSFRKHWITTER